MAQTDPLNICQYPKHKGKPWTEVVEIDYKYVRWLISGEGPDSIMQTEGLYDHLEELCEELQGYDPDEGPQFGEERY